MTITLSSEVRTLCLVVVAALAVATVVGQLLKLRAKTDKARATVANLNARTWAWWVMCGVVFGATLGGTPALIALFGVISFLALREFITLTYTRRADHRTLFWSFFIITPLQYLLIAYEWYGMFLIFIPVYAFLFVAIAGTIQGDTRHYLERTAKVQWSLFVCVYCISHIPALLRLPVPGFESRTINLLLFLLVVTECNDVFQYVWGKTLGRHKVAPHVSPNKTWEGLIGGTLTAVAIGAGLAWMTPFNPWQAAGMALVITLMGFGGGIVMSAIKRDAGVKDFGNLLAGHGGILDRMDSLAFAAPVFFHLTRFYFTAGGQQTFAH